MPGPRGERNGRWRPALERFIEKCAFDPVTGCVMWVGGQTSGHGHNEPYGAFWFEGERWLAHRWSAKYIHKFEITGLQVDHNCPCGPSTLCVHHVQPETVEVNRALQHLRPGRAFQSLDTRQYWMFVTKDIEPFKIAERVIPEIPFFQPPDWLKPYLPVMENVNDCPF